MTYADFWKGKKAAIVGMGPRGEMRTDVKFLIGLGVPLTIYDMRGKAALRKAIVDVKTAILADSKVEWRFGAISGEELAKHDVIIMSPDMPRAADFLKEARHKGVPIEYPDILALKLAPAVTVIGVMGACGKSAIISMLAAALKRGFRAAGDAKAIAACHVMDSEEGGCISLLKRLKKDDAVILRMTDRMLADYAKARVSPQVAILAILPALSDALGAVSAVLAHQTYNSFIVTTDEIADLLHDSADRRPRSKVVRTRLSRVPKEWGIAWRGIHEREDASLAAEAAALFKVDESQIRSAFADYAGTKAKDQVEYIKKSKSVAFYNDAASETPQATLAALQALKAADSASNIVLIMGGASTEADYGDFLGKLTQYANTVMLVPGSGTAAIRKGLAAREGLRVLSSPSVEAAVKAARSEARPGDRVLYSPAFAAAGYDRSRSERGERFVKAVRGLW